VTNIEHVSAKNDRNVSAKKKQVVTIAKNRKIKQIQTTITICAKQNLHTFQLIIHPSARLSQSLENLEPAECRFPS